MKTLFFVGTRPECIKVAPIYLYFKRKFPESTFICNTGQHDSMINQVFQFFRIKPDFNLKVMKHDQNLSGLSSLLIAQGTEIVSQVAPDFVFVHGDTTTSTMMALVSFYNKRPICHIEAGLRTGDIYSPFPEEMNRKINTALSSYHFAPTKKAFKNLKRENVPECNIAIVGNSAIDALRYLNLEKSKVDRSSKKILITIHRGENRKENLDIICNEILLISKSPNVKEIIFPVHLNPKVRETIYKTLSKTSKIKLCEPLEYGDFIETLCDSDIVITDSGGIQEEVTFLGIPTLVLRTHTERPEAISDGPCQLIKSLRETSSTALKLIDNQTHYKRSSKKSNVFGDGNTAEQIYLFLNEKINE